MKPGALPLRARPRPMCQVCDFIVQQPVSRRAFLSTSTLQAPSIRRQPTQQNSTFQRIHARPFIATKSRDAQELEPESAVAQQLPERIAALKSKLAQVEAHINAIYASNKVEAEAAILAALKGLEAIAQEAIAIRARQPSPAKLNLRQSSASAILSGLVGDEELPDGNRKRSKSKATAATINDLPSPSYLSKLAEDVVKFKTVFISPKILQAYINLQRLLGRPRAIPEILFLYAHKPVPQLGSSPPKYSKPSPNSPRQAIPDDICHDALTAAIEAKDLALALDIIEYSVCTKAWRRNRLLKKFGLPGVGLALTPLGLYMLAQEASLYSNYLDPYMFKMYALGGLITYATCTGTLGYIALTTFNWHHVRVRWQLGTGLTERYIREGERAALDRVAQAWGFKEEWRRGDEEGEDWEGLKQWCYLRSMVLDRSESLPGMNPGQ